jgi:hypothetical protein
MSKVIEALKEIKRACLFPDEIYEVTQQALAQAKLDEAFISTYKAYKDYVKSDIYKKANSTERICTTNEICARIEKTWQAREAINECQS